MQDAYISRPSFAERCKMLLQRLISWLRGRDKKKDEFVPCAWQHPHMGFTEVVVEDVAIVWVPLTRACVACPVELGYALFDTEVGEPSRLVAIRVWDKVLYRNKAGAVPSGSVGPRGKLPPDWL